MFVALPFLIFYASFSLLLGIYDARTGLLPDRFTCPLLWGGLLYHQICLPELYRMRFGVLSPAMVDSR